MYRRLPKEEKLKLIRRIKSGEKISKICQEAGVSRTILYRWLKDYRKKPLPLNRHSGPLRQSSSEASLSRISFHHEDSDRDSGVSFDSAQDPQNDGAAKYRRHWKKLSVKTENKIIKLALKNPALSPYALAKIIGVSQHGVWNVLKRNNLNTRQAREIYIHNNGDSLVRSLNVNDRVTMMRRLENGERASDICRDFKVSRTVFYRWLKRHREAPELDKRKALESLRPNGERHWRFVPGASNLVLQIVLEHPEFSAQKISDALFVKTGKKLLGNHGVHNTLKRLNLNTYQRRLAYVKFQERVSPVPQVERGWRIPIFGEIPSVSALAPPGFLNKLISSKFFLPLLSVIFLGFASSVVLSNLGYGQGIVGKIGILFSFVALFFGMFFFIYSLKYYLTIAIVLSFSRRREEDKDTGGASPAFAKASAFGSTESAYGQTKSARQAGGLKGDLSHITLERHPFVSIHIATYNEKRVIERLLKAATSMDYAHLPGVPLQRRAGAAQHHLEGGSAAYEVIVVDDSNDETTSIIQQFVERWNQESGIKNQESGKEKNHDSYFMIHDSKPRIKVIHRNTREGFKGGALKEALKHTDKRAEFVVVLDADFIPYPDTIVQFLKYFQATAGTLDLGHVAGSTLRVEEKTSTSHEPRATSSPIAAVQGYQWHVLNKSENWITRGVRSEYSGSYVIERSGEEIYEGLKQISGSVYMIRRDVLDSIGWGTSITEDFQLTLKLYELGYKVVYTPYIQSPAEAVSTIKRLIRQRMRWAEGHSHNIRKMFIRLLFGKWEANPAIASSGLTKDTNIHERHENSFRDFRKQIRDFREHNENRVWKQSPLTLPEKLEFLYLAPYYLQAAFFIFGTLSWFIAEVVFKVRLPFWTEVWGWSLVFTNLLALPLMNMVGLFMEESEERDYLGLLSFIILSYIVAPFQGYAALKGFLAKEEGPWFRTPKTGRITDVFMPGRLYRWVREIFGGRVSPSTALSTTNNERITTNIFAFASAHNSFSNFRIRRKTVGWVGNASIAILLIVTIFLTNFANTLQFSASAYAAKPLVKTVAGARNELRYSNETEGKEKKHPENEKKIIKNATGKEITGYRSIAKQTKNGETVEFIFHQSPRVRIKLGHKEIEFETNRIGGKSVNPKNAKIYQDKEVLYEEIIADVDLKYTINGDLMTEEFIVKNRKAAEVMIRPSNARATAGTVEQTVRTVDVKVVSPGDPTAFGFFSDDGKELFQFGSPFIKDAKGEKNVDVGITLEGKSGGYKLLKTIGLNAANWLSDPNRSYPVAIDPSVIVSGGITEAETSYGGLQRRVVYMSGAVTPAWYAFASDANDASYYRSTDGTTWSAVQDLDSSDADNFNPSISVSGNFIIVFWIDDSGETVEGLRFDTTTAFPHTLGTLCTGNNQGTLGSSFMLTVAVVSATEAVVAFSDTSTDTEFNVFDVTGLDATCAAGSFTTDLTPGNMNITGSEITASDRPVVFPITGNRVGMVFQDGDISYSELDVSSDDWTTNNLTIAAVTDNVYSAVSNGTSFWILTVNSAADGTNFYTCCTTDFQGGASGGSTETVIDADAGGNGDDVTSDLDMDCPASTDCKIVYTDGLDTTAPSLVFVDCNDEYCSSPTLTTVDSDIGAAGDAANPSVDCPSATDCKIVYGDDMDTALPLLRFVDCNDATCSAPPTPINVDTDLGDSTSILYTSLYCVAANDCKILYNDSGLSDLIFVDCNDVNCRTTGNPAGGRAVFTTIDSGAGTSPKLGVKCPASGNCKLTYHDVSPADADGTGDVMFIDCDTTDCVTRNTLDPPLDDSVGTTSGQVPVAIYCAASTTCKVVWGDATGNDFFFAACDSTETCSPPTPSITTYDLDGGTNATVNPSIDIDCTTDGNDCRVIYVGNITSGSEEFYFVDCAGHDCSAIGSVVKLPGPRFKGSLFCPTVTNCKFVYYDGTASTNPTLNFTECDTANCFPSITNDADPWAAQTAVETVSLTYDSTNSDLYAHVIMDTSDQAYWKSSDATTISWGSQTSYAFTAGTLNQISAPEKGAGTAEIGVVLNQTSNFEFAPVPEITLILLILIPILPKTLRRLRKCRLTPTKGNFT